MTSFSNAVKNLKIRRFRPAYQLVGDIFHPNFKATL